jgi:hypothetical protein
MPSKLLTSNSIRMRKHNTGDSIIVLFPISYLVAVRQSCTNSSRLHAVENVASMSLRNWMGVSVCIQNYRSARKLSGSTQTIGKV